MGIHRILVTYKLLYIHIHFAFQNGLLFSSSSQVFLTKEIAYNNAAIKRKKIKNLGKLALNGEKTIKVLSNEMNPVKIGINRKALQEEVQRVQAFFAHLPGWGSYLKINTSWYNNSFMRTQ